MLYLSNQKIVKMWKNMHKEILQVYLPTYIHWIMIMIYNNIPFGSIFNIFCMYHVLFNKKLSRKEEFLKASLACLFTHILKMPKIKKIQRISLQEENVQVYTSVNMCKYMNIFIKVYLKHVYKHTTHNTPVARVLFFKRLRFVGTFVF